MKAAQEVVGDGRILAVLEPRSNTMRLGVHKQSLMGSLQNADNIYLFEPANLGWDLDHMAKQSAKPATVFDDTEKMITRICHDAQPGDHILVMSNGGFESVHGRLVAALNNKLAASA
jgi:UDP-N-acetylmuramate: L-alanyl-gamma-D-glutamyl-meso-diaminopimelate ligase